MPFGLVVQPLAVPDPEEEPIAVVDFGEAGPIRCSRCRAYISPFARFTDQGRRWTCNFCAQANEVPREYFCNLGADGRRRDALERPELSRGTVEYVAPKEYMVRPPMAPAFVFAIDVSYPAVASGATAAVCEALAQALGDLPGAGRASVGVVTFDGALHFYELRPGQERAHMMVVADVDDPYAPVPSGICVPVAEYRAQLEQLLQSIPDMFAQTQRGDCAGVAAVKGALDVLQATGGKVMLFSSTMPNVGLGALKGRDGVGGGGGGGKGAAQQPQGARGGSAGGAMAVAPDEKQPIKGLLPAGKEFHKLATHAAEYQCCIDVFLLSQAHIDVATLGVLPMTTGGQLYHFSHFSASLDLPQLLNDVRWNLVRPQGMEAVMRVRASAGVGVVGYSGAFCKRTATDVDLPAIDSDKAVLVTLKHEDKLVEGAEVCFQAALLYTTENGERRIRVHTVGLPVTAVMSNLFRAADLDAQLCAMSHGVAHAMLDNTNSIHGCRENSLSNCVAALYAYRKYCATNSSSGQLILPEALKLLPLYVLGLHKSPALRLDARLDERAAFCMRLLTVAAGAFVPTLYPRLHNVTNLGPPLAPDGCPAYPPCLWLSSDKIEPDSLYLLENGYELYLYVGGAHVPQELLQEVFGVASLEQVQSPVTLLPGPLPNEHSQALHGLVNAIRKKRNGYLRLRILRRSDRNSRADPLEPAFFNNLIEDRSSGLMSYVEFLCHVHRQIQNKFT